MSGIISKSEFSAAPGAKVVVAFDDDDDDDSALLSSSEVISTDDDPPPLFWILGEMDQSGGMGEEKILLEA
jgi:hypothetical protein